MRLVSAAALQFFLATTAALRGSSSTGIGRSRSSSIGSSSIPFVGRRSSTRPSSSYGVVVVAAAASKSSHSALYASSCDTNNNNNLISNRPQCRRQSTLSLLASPQNKNQRKTNAACRSSILRGGSSATSSFPSSSSSSLLSTTTTTPDTTTTSMTEATPVEIFRTDYQPLPVTVRTVRMEFQLHDDTTLVTTRMTLQKNPPVMMDTLATSSSTTTTTTTSIGGDWVLDGDETSVTLQSIALNGRALVLNVDYTLGPGRLVVPAAVLDAAFADHTTKDTTTGTVELETVVALVPQENTQLSGLYLSDGMYCTQCEAMGFRRITYYPDRPDNMAVFESVRIEADQTLYPLLLSNGNLIEQGMVAAADSNDDSSSAPSASSSSSSNRHYAVWSDPYPKPSYLFAVVAGNLGLLQDTFTTSPSGRTVTLRLYSEPQNVHKLHYAMQSLQRAMQWDQDRFGVCIYTCVCFFI